MSEETRVNKPSDKMLEFAKNIATRLNTKVPENVMNDWEACKQYIDENKDNASRPTDKQSNFAKMIADRKGVTIPDDVAKNGRLLSKWIDENK